ncbi:hypothetical protein ES703_11114 [subsurface metagenome]
MKRMPVTIPTLHNSLSRLMELPDDIKLIRNREKIGLTALAHALSVSKVQLWHWQKGHNYPREPLILLSLISWADSLKNSGGEGENKDNHKPPSDNIIVRPVAGRSN